MNFQDIEILADDIQDVEEFLMVEVINELFESCEENNE